MHKPEKKQKKILVTVKYKKNFDIFHVASLLLPLLLLLLLLQETTMANADQEEKNHIILWYSHLWISKSGICGYNSYRDLLPSPTTKKKHIHSYCLCILMMIIFFQVRSSRYNEWFSKNNNDDYEKSRSIRKKRKFW